MASPLSSDKRLIERSLRKGEFTPADVKEASASLPDLAERVRPVTPEEIDELRSELIREHEVRCERIARRLEEGPPAPPKPQMATEPIGDL
jgi:hypothetical protein